MIGIIFGASIMLTVCSQVTECENARSECWAMKDITCRLDECIHQFDAGDDKVVTKNDSCQAQYIQCKKRIKRAYPTEFKECNQDAESKDMFEARDLGQ